MYMKFWKDIASAAQVILSENISNKIYTSNYDWNIGCVGGVVFKDSPLPGFLKLAWYIFV